MDQSEDALIENWNSVVPKDGIVFHLGDFCFGGPTAWNRVIRKLNGKIYLILGNHDIKNLREGATWRFEGIFQQMYILVDGQRIWLNHCPFLCYGGAYNGSWQLFGHVHSGLDSVEGLDIPRLVNLLPTQYDVGVDNNNYRPVSGTTSSPAPMNENIHPSSLHSSMSFLMAAPVHSSLFYSCFGFTKTPEDRKYLKALGKFLTNLPRRWQHECRHHLML